MQKLLSHTMNKETRDSDDTRRAGDTQRWDLLNKQKTESNLNLPLEQDCKSKKTKCARLGENGA